MSALAPLDLSLFIADRWWVVAIKALLALVYLLVMTLFTIWFERRVVALMQHRKGPNMNGPFGLLQSLADGMKLMFKEDFTPKAAEKVVFMLAPFITAVPAITAFAVIPIAGPVKVPFTDIVTPLQVSDLPVSVLFIVAVASIGVYGIVLAGWSSGSTYALLGALRSSAQVISYEVAMGLALVAVFLYAGSMSTSEIVAQQQVVQHATVFGLSIPLPSWYAVVLIPSFVIYLISMVGETNRAPFDLPEAEGELVGGFHTEYSSMRFAMFFMAEYMNMITVSALATTLFLGGYHAPLPFNLLGLDHGYWGVLWFTLKVIAMLFIFVWLRGTLPRMRYDQFMRFGWRWLIPISLVWIVAVATFRVGNVEGWFSTRAFWLVAGVVFVGLLVFSFFGGGEDRPRAAEATGDFDAFAGGYPVPPMHGQQLPELAGVVSATADDDVDTPGPAERGSTAQAPFDQATSDRLQGRTFLMGLLDPIAGFGVTFKTMFRKTFTENYPRGPKVTAPRFHGRHQLNRWPDGLEKCVGCELCAWACPADAIYVEGAQNTEEERFSPGERYGRVYQINYLRCILCGLCIEACPTRALTMTNEFELADMTRADLIYEKSDLLAPLLPGMEQPPHARRLGDDEQTYFLGLPASGRPDDRAGDLSGVVPEPMNQGYANKHRQPTRAGEGR